MSQYWVYILSSKKNGTLYTGVTSNIACRIHQHKMKLIDGFTSKYDVDKLVYVEPYDRIDDAIYREKCIKRWNRAWKIRLIQEQNPQWRDLYETIL